MTKQGQPDLIRLLFPLAEFKNLVNDIYRVLTGSVRPPAAEVEAFGKRLAEYLVSRLSKPSDDPSLRLSNVGTPCDRKLWYTIRCPELGEKLSGATRLKFLYGDIIELLVTFLARAAGHDVTDEQKEVYVDDIPGHMDGRIDGHVVDVKSSSTNGMGKFSVGGGLYSDDPFGYLTQLGSYATAEDVPEASFLAVDKQHGDIVIDTYKVDKEKVYARITQAKEAIRSDTPPERFYSDLPDGQSGNRKLDVACSYCPFKWDCWPGLRGFAYSKRPVYLTSVRRRPTNKLGPIPEFFKNDRAG